MALELTCTRCFRQAWAMDAHGPIPKGALKIQGFSPAVCVECSAVVPDRAWVVRHQVTEVEWLVNAPTAAKALGIRLKEAEIAAGKILELSVVQAYVKDLTVRAVGETLGEARPALDVLIDNVLRGGL